MSKKWAGGSQGSFFRTQHAFSPSSDGGGSTLHSMRFLLFTLAGIAVINKIFRGNFQGTVSDANVTEIETPALATWLRSSPSRPRDRLVTVEGFVDEKSTDEKK